MSGATVERDVEGVTLSQLVEKLGEAPGHTLFERMDAALRTGDRLYPKTVRAARQTLSSSSLEGAVQFVVPGRAGSAGADLDVDMRDGFFVISVTDLEAVVKANNPEFDWAEEFAPRRDLPIASTRLHVKSGAPGQNSLKF